MAPAFVRTTSSVENTGLCKKKRSIFGKSKKWLRNTKNQCVNGHFNFWFVPKIRRFLHGLKITTVKFRYATKYDIFLICLAMITSTEVGLSQPAMMIIFGDMTDSFVDAGKYAICDNSTQRKRFCLFLVVCLRVRSCRHGTGKIRALPTNKF